MAQETFTQEQVWAAATAAQRINGAYIKWPKSFRKFSYNGYYDFPSAYQLKNKVNNALQMIIMLKNNMMGVIPEDYVNGQTIREHYLGLSYLIFSGEAKEFYSKAYNAALLTEVSINKSNSRMFNMIASLPNDYQNYIIRSERRKDLEKVQAISTPIGKQNEIVSLTITVLDVVEHPKYVASFVVNARALLADNQTHIVYFFDSRSWVVGEIQAINARIKKINNNKTTQLEQVYIIR